MLHAKLVRESFTVNVQVVERIDREVSVVRDFGTEGCLS